MAGERWLSDRFRDAMWECENLDATAKAVAEVYARHAKNERGERGPAADLAWLTYERLMAKAGIARRANVAAAVRRLVEAGWLTVTERVSRRPTLYRLTIPASSTIGTTESPGSSISGTTEPPVRSSDGGTTVVPLSRVGSSTLPGFDRSRSSTGGTPLLEELHLEENTPSLSRERSSLERLLSEQSDLRDDERENFLIHIEPQCKNGRSGLAAYLRRWEPGDLQTAVDAWRGTGTRAPRPPKCDACDESRHLTVFDEDGRPAATRCPNCHPAVVAGPAAPATVVTKTNGYQAYRQDPNANYYGEL